MDTKKETIDGYCSKIVKSVEIHDNRTLLILFEDGSTLNVTGYDYKISVSTDIKS